MAAQRVIHNSISPQLFRAPEASRRIVAGFTYLQRIRKGATTTVWFPKQSLETFRISNGIQWAAVRQFELLQEADNLMIDDLDVMDIKRTFRAMERMRAGGYSLTILTLGTYASSYEQDDLAILDQKIGEEIAQMIHFLYLADLSGAINTHVSCDLARGRWRCDQVLPHVARAMSERALFRPAKQTLAEKTFFDILEKLSPRHILHETAIGLALPDSTKEKNWVYIAAPENRFATFQNTMHSLFEALDSTHAEPQPVMRHMRGYGDRDVWRKQAG